MNNLSQIPCEKCGSPTVMRSEGSTQGLYCTKCDWSVVTTHIPEILLDTTVYEIRLTGGDYRNEEHVKTVAHVSGVNFLAARKLLQQKSPLVFTGLASRIVEIRKTLNSVNLKHQINPAFFW
jgi:hypothetical protein